MAYSYSCSCLFNNVNLNVRYIMANGNLKLKAAFQLAMADMTDVLCLEAPTLIHSVERSLETGFEYQVLYSWVDWWNPVGVSYLNTKEQRQLNSKLGITKSKGIINWYKN
jgi:hypothetical protein